VFRFDAVMPAPTSASNPHAERWLGSVQTPPFEAPTTWDVWHGKREATRASLGKMLGDFPPCPAVPQVTVLFREEGEGYSVEKFRFNNGLGMTVPGYLFLPKGVNGKVPALLYCHWHGGQYDNGKSEMLSAEHTPVLPGPTLARLGYAVLGIDA
jgi:hypothetical protein